MTDQAWRRPSPDEAIRALESIRRMIRLKRRLQLVVVACTGIMVGLLLGIAAAHGSLL